MVDFDMKYSTQIKPISYLKNHTAEIVKDLSASRQPMLVTQHNEAKLVLLDIKSFEEYEETLAMLKLLAIGNKAIDSGNFKSADDVFTDLEKE